MPWASYFSESCPGPAVSVGPLGCQPTRLAGLLEPQPASPASVTAMIAGRFARLSIFAYEPWRMREAEAPQQERIHGDDDARPGHAQRAHGGAEREAEGANTPAATGSARLL
jgi:hypothetical protein